MVLSGWNRIGIILSITWLLLFWGYTGIEYRRYTPTPFEERILFKKVEEESQSISEYIPSAGKKVKLVPLKPSLRWVPFLSISFLPIICSWIFLYVARKHYIINIKDTLIKDKQKTVLLITAFVLVLMLLLPVGRKEAFIYFIKCLIVIAIGIICWFAFKEKPK